EPDEQAVVVVQTTAISKWLEPRIRVLRDPPELVVVDPLGDRAVSCVDHEPDTAEMVKDKPVRDTALHHVVRHIHAGGIHEAAYQSARAVELSYRRELRLPEPPFLQDPVHLLPHPPVLAIDHVVDDRAARQQDLHQIA